MYYAPFDFQWCATCMFKYLQPCTQTYFIADPLYVGLVVYNEQKTYAILQHEDTIIAFIRTISP